MPCSHNVGSKSCKTYWHQYPFIGSGILCRKKTEPYNSLLSKSIAKWREFHGDIFELGEAYSLVVMSGQLYPCNRRAFFLKKLQRRLGKNSALSMHTPRYSKISKWRVAIR